MGFLTSGFRGLNNRAKTKRALAKPATAAISATLLFCLATNVATDANAQLSNNEPRTVELLNGMRFSGRLGSLPGMGPTTSNLTADATHHGIVLIDDDLREIFVARSMVANTAPFDQFEGEEEFEIWQRIHNGDGLGTEIGATLHIGPVDEFGRRAVTIDSRRGPVTVIQGITKINPRYIRWQGVVNTLGAKRHWDLRESITSIPTSVLVTVLERQIQDVDDSNERMRLVEFYMQANKYKQAEKALRDIGRDFPGLKEELKQRVDLLRGQATRQALEHATLRFNAGQPGLASELVKSMQERIDIASGILVEISELKKQIEAADKEVEVTRTTTLEVVNRVLAAETTGVELKEALEIFVQEIGADLTPNTVDRLSTFVRFADDKDQTDEEKVMLALSGWVVGAGFNPKSIGEAQSLFKSRALVTEYLQTPRIDRRLTILEEFETMETGAPEYLDRIIKNMKPPLAPSRAEISTVRPMEFEIEVPVRGGRTAETAKYLVQLPPEYDPYRRYPCILTLGGGTVTTTPPKQINYWAGPVHERTQVRTGLASSHGFIVVAPEWMEPRQSVYKYSAREHAIVLKTLRDAMRRFSIDSDRVFLSGHFAGANAAWDIGQSHPEHWAGVIPISARVGKYINHYRDNGKSHMRWYFINGGRDFDSKRANATIWNKHMSSPGFDSIVVNYKGRGTERFSDELPNLFLWMSPQRRQFDVREFNCATMRPWDNYFWWLEIDLQGHPKMVMPEVNWNAVKNKSNWDVTGEIKDVRPNYYYIRGALENAIIWVSPGLVDFSRDIEIGGGGTSGKFKGEVKPSRKTILEDVRTRADRQHAYWAKIVRKRNVWRVEE